MHLKSITLKGFKSFPDRTRLEFGPGVSVIVGPNGSGKSNVTDAVLWALGEQSPLAVRGQSMQDVIFSGARGQQARGAAEVELVIDNGDGAAADLDFAEVAISRRLDRNGEGEYRLNGARCRLVDVLEALSDTGLGKEMHSVVSQGRVEAVVTSKPRDRRLLIEEAAGLGKHRKRRRRAQLKLARTQENLDRALDVEREARSRLRPLKRQAEAAELHERLERQATEARWELARDRVRAGTAALAEAESAAAAARAARDEVDRELAAVAAQREAAEQALAERGARRDALSARAFAARAAHERVELRLEQVRATAASLDDRAARTESRIAELEAERAGDDTASEPAAAAPGPQGAAAAAGPQGAAAAAGPKGAAAAPGPQGAAAAAGPKGAAAGPSAADRIASLEAELAALDSAREVAVADQVAELERRRDAAATEVERLEAAVAEREAALEAADAAAERARAERDQADAALEAAGREAARIAAELAAVNQFLATRGDAPGGTPSLADRLDVAPGYELALAAALDDRLRAAVVDDLPAGTRLLDRAGDEGGRALVAGAPAGPSPPDGGDGAPAGAPPPAATDAAPAGAPPPGAGSPPPGAPPPGAGSAPPVPGAEPLLAHLRGDGPPLALARRLLADAWVVERLEDLPDDFAGIAVTRAGRAWFGAARELRQAPAGGEDRRLAQRNRRDELIRETERAAGAERAATRAVEAAATAVADADATRVEADRALRAAGRERDQAAEEERRAGWLIEQRRTAPDEGPAGERRAELEAALAAERRLADQAERARAAAAARLRAARDGLDRVRALAPSARRLAQALEAVAGALAEHAAALDAELDADRAAGEGVAAELRACAHREAELQGRLRERAEAVTGAEVRAQQARDQAAEGEAELRGLAASLELPARPADRPLPDEEREALSARIERLARRREQLGPVNPLAKEEHAEAVAHVEELETQRRDLETALRELRQLIADTDRRIREAFEQTFAAAAANFEELVGQLFPGGRGQLRLVRDDAGPRPVLGGQESPGSEGEEPPDDEPRDEDERFGVEIEMTPAGKTMKRLSLLSGGEKSLTALAFLFAIFLARPCPFYVLDEVEAALDDLNIDRFLRLLRRYAERAQFIVVTHQKRTMEAADTLYGVSMGDDGVSRVISRRLPREEARAGAEPSADGGATPAAVEAV
jgi:chromosome segregation protein